MKIKGLDHLVITTEDYSKCRHFYHDILGLEVTEKNGRRAFLLDKQKINIHCRPGEFLPAALRPTLGSQDLCLIVEDDDIEKIKEELCAKGWPLEAGPVPRNGALGPMDSIYVRDPDGNLVELAVYRKR